VTDFDEAALAIVRRAYARQMLAVAGVEDAALEAAFATVRRERFIGPPPWQIT
jgi:protein-L-isoaspartate(D-aspartate) O-methyltransferase